MQNHYIIKVKFGQNHYKNIVKLEITFILSPHTFFINLISFEILFIAFHICNTISHVLANCHPSWRKLIINSNALSLFKKETLGSTIYSFHHWYHFLKEQITWAHLHLSKWKYFKFNKSHKNKNSLAYYFIFQ